MIVPRLQDTKPDALPKEESKKLYVQSGTDKSCLSTFGINQNDKEEKS